MHCREKRYFRNSSLTIAMAAAWLSALPAFGAPAPVSNMTYRPEWAEALSEYGAAQPNRSYLDEVPEVRPLAPHEEVGLGALLSPHIARQMQQEYHDMTREYEMRERYDQVEARVERRAFMERVQSFARYFLQRVFHFQVQEHLREAEKNSPEVRTFKAVNDQVQSVVEDGLAMKVEESDFKFQMGTRADLKNQKGRFWMNSSIVDGVFDFDFSEVFQDEIIDPVSRRDRDRYRVSLKRSLPVWGIYSGVSYGLTTTLMKATLSKRLMKRLNVEVASIHEVDREKSLRPRDEQTVRLSYGIEF